MFQTTNQNDSKASIILFQRFVLDMSILQFGTWHLRLNRDQLSTWDPGGTDRGRLEIKKRFYLIYFGRLIENCSWILDTFYPMFHMEIFQPSKDWTILLKIATNKYGAGSTLKPWISQSRGPLQLHFGAFMSKMIPSMTAQNSDLPTTHYWLVVYLPLWEIWVNWDYYSQYMEKNNIPNHQPD